MRIFFLQLNTYLRLVIPNTTPSLVSQLRVPAALSPAGTPLAMEPHLLRHRSHQRNSQTHSLGTPAATNPVNIVALLVRQRHVDDKRQTGHVETPGGDVGANHEAHLFALEELEVGLAFLRFTVTVEANAGELVAAVGLWTPT